MAASVSRDGHDCGGGLLSGNNSLANADTGHTYFDTSVNQFYVCLGTGTFPANFVTVGSAGAVAPGGAGSSTTVRKILTAMTNDTYTDVCTITVPNAVHGAGIHVSAVGILGDGDSAQMTEFNAAIARIAGAATGCTIGSAIGAGTKNGATANASISIQASANTGANSATQTFTLQMKVTRSGGSAANHVLVATVTLMNGFASGVTIA